MPKNKSSNTKSLKKESILDKLLWIVENYLPQKAKRPNHIDLLLSKLEKRTIKEIQKLASVRSELLSPAVTNTKVSFTVGNWALPYLNLLKQLGIMK